MLNREVLFVIVLLFSLFVSAIFNKFGNFRFKKELLSIIGIIQLAYFCQWDIFHVLILITVGTTLCKELRCHPRVVFVYCVLHRFFFSCSAFFGLPRDTSNLANATMFVATLKMITVAYEIADYRLQKKHDKPSNDDFKKKWVILDREPTAAEIFCYMTCFVALFTGPPLRYKTFHDMLYKFTDAPIRNELKLRSRIFVISAIFFGCLIEYNPSYYKNGLFYEHNFPMRLWIMTLIALTQGFKYCLCWMAVEGMCVLIGLGAYPVSTAPMPGKGPSKELHDTEDKEDIKYNFDTVSNSQMLETLAAPNFKGALQNWNPCVQWWLATFIYSSSIFPPQWKLFRVFAVLFMSAALHGIKVGYFMSFPMLLIPLIAETIWSKSIEPKMVGHTFLYNFYKTFTWIFCKTLVFFHLISIFLLQDFDEILKFCESTYYYSYTVPALYLFLGLMIKVVLPRNQFST